MGRPTIEFPKDFEKVYIRWRNKELQAVEAMTLLGLSKPTWYRMKKKYESETRGSKPGRLNR